jgi:multiple sugar transport system substrate-binding protein
MTAFRGGGVRGMGQPSQASGTAIGDYVPKPKGTSWMIPIVLLVVGLLAGSGIGYLAAPRPVAKETLTVIGPWAGAEMEAFLPVLDTFAANTGITVSYSNVRQEDLRPLLVTQFTAHRAPADVMFMVSSFIREHGTSGDIVDVTDLVNPANVAVGATPGTELLSPVTDASKIYGGIYTGKVKPGFWYRQSFFTQHSLSPPTNWAEFTALLNTIAGIQGVTAPIVSGDTVGWPLSDVTEHFIATYGGANMHRGLANKTIRWDSTAVRDVFANRIVPLLSAGRFSEPLAADSTALARWWNNEYPLYFMGSWIGNWIKALQLTPAPDLNDLRVFPLPSESGVTPGVVFAADYMFIPKYTTRLSAARQLFSFLLSVEGQSAQVAQGGHVATRTGVPNSAYPPGDLAVAQSLAGKEVLADLDDTIGGSFQQVFWNQLIGLWTSTNPAGDLDPALAAIQAAVPP